MCKGILCILKCLGTFVNAIVLMSGITFIIVGTYVYIKVDFKDLLGDEYKKYVPPEEEFSEMDGGGTLKDINDFFDKHIEELDDVFRDVVIGIIVLGCILTVFGIFGLIVIKCGSKKWLLLIIYLTLLVPVFIVCLALTIYFEDPKTFQDSLFDHLEKFAYDDAAPKRFFMAALQKSFKCCGVRSPIDYYCQGTYDYSCNPGCLTTNAVWNVMATSGQPPLCHKTARLERLCRLTAPAEECRKKLNVIRPIYAKDSTVCQNYKDKFELDGKPQETWNFQMYDRGEDYNRKDQFRIRGSVYSEQDSYINSLYGNRNPIGCGFAAWNKVSMKDFLFSLFIDFIVITIATGILILMTVFCLIYACKEKNKQKQDQEQHQKEKNENHNDDDDDDEEQEEDTE